MLRDKQMQSCFCANFCKLPKYKKLKNYCRGHKTFALSLSHSLSHPYENKTKQTSSIVMLTLIYKKNKLIKNKTKKLSTKLTIKSRLVMLLSV